MQNNETNIEIIIEQSNARSWRWVIQDEDDTFTGTASKAGHGRGSIEIDWHTFAPSNYMELETKIISNIK
jgi:hypothetical protein